MITEITINNFKAFGDGAPLVLSRVNLLFEKMELLISQRGRNYLYADFLQCLHQLSE